MLNEVVQGDPTVIIKHLLYITLLTSSYTNSINDTPKGTDLVSFAIAPIINYFNESLYIACLKKNTQNV